MRELFLLIIIWIAWSHCDYVVKIPRRYHGQDWTNIFWWSHLRYILSPYAGILIWISSIIKWYNWCCNMKCDPQFGELMHCFNTKWLIDAYYMQGEPEMVWYREKREFNCFDHWRWTLYEELVQKTYQQGIWWRQGFILFQPGKHTIHTLNNVPFIWTLFIWTALSSDFDEGFTNCAHVLISNNKV